VDQSFKSTAATFAAGTKPWSASGSSIPPTVPLLESFIARLTSLTGRHLPTPLNDTRKDI
jgi:hypothetical protein